MSDREQEERRGKEKAHRYFTHPDKPGVILCIPERDIDTTGMYSYFAQFLPEKDDPDFWNVSFPDLPGCLSCGKGLKQAMANAIDALGGYINIAKLENIPIPEPSDMTDVIAKAQMETAQAGLQSTQPPLYLLVTVWPDI